MKGFDLDRIEIMLDEVEKDLRQGRRDKAQKKLFTFLEKKKKSRSHKLPRQFIALISEKLRRAGLPEYSFKLLYSFVKYQGVNYKGLNIFEHQEFAATLIVLGAVEEAEYILKKLLPFNSPKTLLFLGFAAIHQWDYEGAITYFEEYLSGNDLPEYEKWIGQVNLMASKVVIAQSIDDLQKLEKSIQNLVSQADKKGFKILYINLCEIQTQLDLKTKSSSLIESDTQKIQQLIQNPMSKENLFIQKWYWLARRPTTRQENSEEVKIWIKNMEIMQAKARIIGHIETIRDIDFFLAFYNPELINKLYYGTHFQSYRNRILSTFKKDLKSFYWHSLETNNSIELNIFKKNQFMSFDYRDYKDFTFGSLLHRVLMALVSDFYKKQNKYALFYKIFPGEHLNPYTSFNKLHQAFHRTKEWLKINNIPFEIIEENSSYSLMGRGKIKIYLEDLNLQAIPEAKTLHELEKVKKYFGRKSFTSEQLLNCLFSEAGGERKAQRWLAKALNLNFVTKTRKGRTFLYQICDDIPLI